MSVQAITRVLGTRRAGEWEVPPLVTPSKEARLALISLANHADEDGTAWPSVEAIAGEAGLSERATQRALCQLRDAGLIKVVVNGAPDRRIRPDQRPNLYLLMFLRGATDGTPCPNGVPRVVERGATRGNDGVPRVAPEPSVEPSEEPSKGDVVAADAAPTAPAADAAPAPTSSGASLREEMLGVWRRGLSDPSARSLLAALNLARAHAGLSQVREGKPGSPPSNWLHANYPVEKVVENLAVIADRPDLHDGLTPWALWPSGESKYDSAVAKLGRHPQPPTAAAKPTEERPPRWAYEDYTDRGRLHQKLRERMPPGWDPSDGVDDDAIDDYYALREACIAEIEAEKRVEWEAILARRAGHGEGA